MAQLGTVGPEVLTKRPTSNGYTTLGTKRAVYQGSKRAVFKIPVD